MNARAWTGIAAALISGLAALLLTDATLPVGGGSALPNDHSSPAPTEPSQVDIDVTAGSEPGRRQIERLLGQVDVIAERPTVDGYDRECGTGHACSFGPAWSDDTDAELGHDGCDTRNGMLAASLRDPVFEPDTNGCVVSAGVLDDPYTGQRIRFTKDRAYEVGVDHMIPLARAWDLGAATWSLEQRQRFANDPLNLIVVSGSANSSKSDRGPGEWMPINSGFRCTYVMRYLQVAKAYQLPVVEADAAAIDHVAEGCAPQRG